MEWGDIECKVVSYLYEPIGYEMSDTYSKTAYERVVKDQSTVYVIWNVTFYTSKEIANEILELANENLYRKIDESFKREIASNLRQLINHHYMEHRIFLKDSPISKVGMAVFYKDEAFKLYRRE